MQHSAQEVYACRNSKPRGLEDGLRLGPLESGRAHGSGARGSRHGPALRVTGAGPARPLARAIYERSMISAVLLIVFVW